VAGTMNTSIQTKWNSRNTVALVLVGVSLLIWRLPLVATFGLALHNDAYTHILLILPVSAALIYLERKSLSSHVAPSPYGAILLVISILIFGLAKWGLAGRPDQGLFVSMCGLVICWIGVVLFCFGSDVFRKLMFPLCFPLWLAPIPAVALNKIVDLLQEGSASFTHLLFNSVGIPVNQNGVVLSIPGLNIEVAKECSSIRSSLMLLVTSLILAQVFLRSVWRKIFVVLVAIPLTVVKNGIRIFTLAVLGTYVDPAFLTGRLHHNGGILFFLLALAVIFGVLWILRRAEGNRDAPVVVAAQRV
jgi:exosortase